MSSTPATSAECHPIRPDEGAAEPTLDTPSFMKDAALRHMVFLEEEAAAASPCERWRVFAACTLREVQMRRWGLEVDAGKRMKGLFKEMEGLSRGLEEDLGRGRGCRC